MAIPSKRPSNSLVNPIDLAIGYCVFLALLPYLDSLFVVREFFGWDELDRRAWLFLTPYLPWQLWTFIDHPGSFFWLAVAYRFFVRDIRAGVLALSYLTLNLLLTLFSFESWKGNCGFIIGAAIFFRAFLDRAHRKDTPDWAAKLLAFWRQEKQIFLTYAMICLFGTNVLSAVYLKKTAGQRALRALSSLSEEIATARWMNRDYATRRIDEIVQSVPDAAPEKESVVQKASDLEEKLEKFESIRPDLRSH